MNTLLRNLGWDRPQAWSNLGAQGQADWNENAENIEQFYRDMRTARHINTGLSSWMTPDEKKSYQNFLKILEDHEKITSAVDMLYTISISSGGAKRLVSSSQGLLNEKDLPYVFLSTFGFVLIQVYEFSVNIFKKTLTTMSLFTKKGVRWKKSIEDSSPDTLFDLLAKDSPVPVSFILDRLFKYKRLRNALSHGLFWFESGSIYYIENVNSPKADSITLKDYFSLLPEQIMFSQCLLWVTSKLLQEKFFEP